MDLVNRYETNIPGDRKLTMWTFGSNWKYTPLNYVRIKDIWTKFQKRLRRTLEYNSMDFTWRPLFRAFERGSKSDYLHVHVLTVRQDHEIKWEYKGVKGIGVQPLMRQIWGKIIGIDPDKVHVNYNNGNDKKNTPKDAFRYITKYMAKGIKDVNLDYAHYMGKPLWRHPDKTNLAKYKFINEIQGHKFEFAGLKPEVIQERKEIRKNWFEKFAGKLSLREKEDPYEYLRSGQLEEFGLSSRQYDLHCNKKNHIMYLGDRIRVDECECPVVWEGSIPDYKSLIIKGDKVYLGDKLVRTL